MTHPSTLSQIRQIAFDNPHAALAAAVLYQAKIDARADEPRLQREARRFLRGAGARAWLALIVNGDAAALDKAHGWLREEAI